MDTRQGLTYAEIRNTILENVPQEIGITRIEFEGPRLAIYTQKPEILLEKSHIVAEIAGTIKKRIVVRSDPSVRLRRIASMDARFLPKTTTPKYFTTIDRSIAPVTYSSSFSTMT